ncbi:MAG: hypothetical protein K2X82_12155 [Gemmataceae bacterium]|nr:hypothetical protein [Gemmataceae bacterium]
MATLVTAALTLSPLAGPAAPDGLARQILATKEAAEQDRPPMMLVYDVKMRFTPSHLAATKLTQAVPGADGLTIEYDVRLAYRGETVGMHRGGTMLTPEGVVRLKEPARYLYDGRKLTAFHNGRYQTGSKAKLLDGIPTPWSVAGEEALLRVLRDWRDGVFARRGLDVQVQTRAC